MALHLDPSTLMVQQQSYPRPWMNAPGARMPQGYAPYSADAEKTLSAEVNLRNRSAISSNIHVPSSYQSMPIPVQRVQYPTWSFDSNFDPLAYDLEPTMRPGQEDLYLAQSTPGSSMHACSTSLPDYLQEGRSFDESFHHMQAADARSSGGLECKWQHCTYRGSFKTEASLFRHVKHMHISPRAFKCPHCDACKGRKDSLMSHIRSVHLDQVQG